MLYWTRTFSRNAHNIIVGHPPNIQPKKPPRNDSPAIFFARPNNKQGQQIASKPATVYKQHESDVHHRKKINMRDFDHSHMSFCRSNNHKDHSPTVKQSTSKPRVRAQFTCSWRPLKPLESILWPFEFLLIFLNHSSYWSNRLIMDIFRSDRFPPTTMRLIYRAALVSFQLNF